MTEEKKIGYVFGVVADIGNGVQFSLNTNFDSEITLDEMNARVDMLRAVFNRQQAKSAAIAARQELDVLGLRIRVARSDFEDGDAKRGDRHLTAAERQQREAAIAHTKQMELDLEFKTGVLSKLEAEAK